MVAYISKTTAISILAPRPPAPGVNYWPARIIRMGATKGPRTVNYMASGAFVYGRTMERGAFDLKPRLMIVPRGHVRRTHARQKPTSLGPNRRGAITTECCSIDT